MDSLDPSQATVCVPAGRRTRIVWRSPRRGRAWLRPSAVNRKARKRGAEPGSSRAPAHNAGPERGIINTRGQGRAAGTMGRGRVEKAAGDEHRTKATLWGGDAAQPLGFGGAAGPRRVLGLVG